LASAKTIMTTDVITVKDQTPIREAIEILVEKEISGLPVIDDEKKLVGLITEKDLLKLIFTGEIDLGIVADYMTREVVALDEETDLLDVCEYLMDKNFKRIPILKNGILVGIISRRDMIKYILKMH
jgi:CBS domain-containing protein